MKVPLIELCKYTAHQHLGDNENNYDSVFSTAQELLEAVE